MPKFIIRDTIPCYVTWSFEIEAETAEEAEDLFMDGDQGQELGFEIGDSIEFMPNEISVEKIKE